MKDPKIDSRMHKILSTRQPTMLQVIRKLLDSGETPEQIARFAATRCPGTSSIPGLIEGAARHMQREEAVA